MSLRLGLTTLALIALGGCGQTTDDAATPAICERLDTCGLIARFEDLQQCIDEVAAQDTSSCQACVGGASCAEVADAVCQQPCSHVITAASGGEELPPSLPSSSGGGGSSGSPPVAPLPAEVTALCSTLAQCRIQPSRNASCAEVYRLGLALGEVTLLEIERCDACLEGAGCELSACTATCQNVL